MAALELSEQAGTPLTSRIWLSFDWDISFYKTDHNYSCATDSITGFFFDLMSCDKPLVSQPNILQIQLSGTVLESSGPADSETVIDFHIWPKFEGVIEVSLGDNWKEHCCIDQI